MVGVGGNGLTTGTEGPRHEYFYFSNNGDLTGLRYDRWKSVIREQLAKGLDVWIEPFNELRGPQIIDLRADPFERAPEESANYDTWFVEHIFLLYPVSDYVRRFYATFLAYPPTQPTGVIGRLELLLQVLDQYQARP